LDQIGIGEQVADLGERNALFDRGLEPRLRGNRIAALEGFGTLRDECRGGGGDVGVRGDDGHKPEHCDHHSSPSEDDGHCRAQTRRLPAWTGFSTSLEEGPRLRSGRK